MGNLRSVSQAVLHVAPGSGVEVRRHRPTPTRCCAAERVVLPGPGRDARLHARAARFRPAGRGARRRRAASRCWACASACRCCSTTARSGDTPGLGLIPGAGACASGSKAERQPDGSRFKVPQMGWNEVRQARAAPAVAGRARRRAASISCTATTCDPRDPRHTRRATPTTAPALPAPSRAITFSPRSSTPRRAPTHGLALYRNFLTWNP